MGYLDLAVLVFVGRGKRRNTWRKTSRSKERTNNKLNPRMTPGPGIEPGPQWWQASALTTASPLLPFTGLSDSRVRRLGKELR